MPEVGDDFCGDEAGDFGAIEVSPSDEEECADAGDKVQGVSAGKDVEIAAGGIAGEIDPLGNEFGPGDDLADEEGNAESCGDEPEALEAGVVETGEATASEFEADAAGEENDGVVPHEPRDDDGMPIAVRALVVEEGRRKGHEEHENGNDAEGDADVVAHRGGAVTRVVAIFVAAAIASCGRLRTAAVATDVFDDEFDVARIGSSGHDVFLGPHFLGEKFRGKILREEGVGISGGKFVGTAVDDCRGGVPFESGGVPGIRGPGVAWGKQRGDEIPEEQELGGDGAKRCDHDEAIEREKCGEEEGVDRRIGRDRRLL